MLACADWTKENQIPAMTILNSKTYFMNFFKK